MTRQQQIEIEAAAFRGLLKHLQDRTDVQNIDLMNLAGFCRNCLSKWYLAEAKNQGMDIKQWKQKYQTEASAEQIQKFEDSKPLHAKISGHT